MLRLFKNVTNNNITRYLDIDDLAKTRCLLIDLRDYSQFSIGFLKIAT